MSSDFPEYQNVANPHFFGGQFECRLFSDVDKHLQKAIRREKWTRADKYSATGSASNVAPTRDVCILWRFGGHGELFDYDRTYEMPGQTCISWLFPRWKTVGDGIYEYK